jgi:hypothetical protein
MNPTTNRRLGIVGVGLLSSEGNRHLAGLDRMQS